MVPYNEADVHYSLIFYIFLGVDLNCSLKLSNSIKVFITQSLNITRITNLVSHSFFQYPLFITKWIETWSEKNLQSKFTLFTIFTIFIIIKFYSQKTARKCYKTALNLLHWIMYCSAVKLRCIFLHSTASYHPPN